MIIYILIKISSLSKMKFLSSGTVIYDTRTRPGYSSTSQCQCIQCYCIIILYQYYTALYPGTVHVQYSSTVSKRKYWNQNLNCGFLSYPGMYCTRVSYHTVHHDIYHTVYRTYTIITLINERCMMYDTFLKKIMILLYYTVY